MFQVCPPPYFYTFSKQDTVGFFISLLDVSVFFLLHKAFFSSSWFHGDRTIVEYSTVCVDLEPEQRRSGKLRSCGVPPKKK